VVIAASVTVVGKTAAVGRPARSAPRVPSAAPALEEVKLVIWE